MSRLRRLFFCFALGIFAMNAFAAPFSAYLLEVRETRDHAAEISASHSSAPLSQDEHAGAACHHACGAHLLSHLQGYAASGWLLPVSPAASAVAPWRAAHAASVYLELPERPPRVLPIA